MSETEDIVKLRPGDANRTPDGQQNQHGADHDQFMKGM
jgi:hypothetical protein